MTVFFGTALFSQTLSNKIFRMLTIPELAILKKHSEKFIRDSVNYRIYEILSNQEDIESLMRSKAGFLSYLQKLQSILF